MATPFQSLPDEIILEILRKAPVTGVCRRFEGLLKQNATSLQLRDSNIDHWDLVSSTTLRSLYIHIREHGLWGVLSQLTRLERLEINDYATRDAGLASISPLLRLTRLELQAVLWSESFGEGVAHLQRLVELRALRLDNNRIEDEHLVHLSALTALTSLKIRHTSDVQGTGLVHLTELTSLEVADFSSCDITSIVHLSSMTSLRHLSLSRNFSMLEQELIHLQPLTQLTMLDLMEIPSIQGLDEQNLPFVFDVQKICKWGY